VPNGLSRVAGFLLQVEVQTLIDVIEKNVTLIRVGNFTEVRGSKKAKTDARSVIVLAGNSCVGGISPSQKSQNGRSDMQSKVQIDQALPQRRRPHLR
jgi:hypothetical protein